MIRFSIHMMVLVAILSACSSSEAQQVKVVSNQELVKLLENKDLQVVDVRTPQETTYGVIKGASTIDFTDPNFAGKIGKLDRNKPIVVYCAAGGRSARAAQKLSELGFSQIYDLGGGMRGWEAEGLPVVKE